VSNNLLRAGRRILVTFAAIAGPTYYMAHSPLLALWQNALDIGAFTLAVGSFVLNWRRTVVVLNTERIRTSHIHTASWQGMMVALMMSSILAIHWRASGHIASINDGGVRILFRWIYDISAFGFLLTAGNYSPDVSWDGFRRVIGWLVILGCALGLIAYLDKPPIDPCIYPCVTPYSIEPRMSR
jgi:hypothetical protein